MKKKRTTKEATTRPPRVLLWDLETAPILADVWEMFDTNVANVRRPTYLLSFSYKELGRKQVITWALPDFPLYKKEPDNDRALVKKLHEVVSSADVLIGHNGDGFDTKKANSRFLAHGLRPPTPHKTIDTLRIARRHFKFDSNKLDNLGKYLGVGKKLPHTGMHLWVSCMAGDKKAWKTMRRYNAQDVLLLEKVYLKMRAWAPGHPDFRIYDGLEGCPTCRSKNVIRRGVEYKNKEKPRFSCNDCGRWYTMKA